MKLTNKIQSWGAEVAVTLSLRWWSFFLTAGVLAAGASELVYVYLDLPQRYSEFVVGAIAWSYQNKFHDYAVLYSFVVAFMVALAAVGTLAVRLRRDFGVEGVDRLHGLLLLLCTPAGLWLGGLVTTSSEALWMLRLSEVLLIAGLLLGFTLSVRGRAFWRQDSNALFRAMQGWLLVSAIAALAVSALGVAANRLGARVHAHQWMTSADAWLWTCIVGVFAVLVGCVVTLRATDAAALNAWMKRSLFVGQVFLPLLLLCMTPPAWIWGADAKLTTGYRLTAIAKFLVLGCMVAAYVELRFRFRMAMRAEAHQSPLEMLSLGCVVAVLLFLKTAPIGLPFVNPDDYHFGEMLVPWWSWVEKGVLPFWDYAPARGLLNYLPGLLNNLLLDGRPASISVTYPFIFCALAVVALPILRASIGLGGAFVAVLLGPVANGFGEIDLVTTLFIAAFCAGYFRWDRARWLATFAFFGIVLLLYTPGQGALTLLACTPLALTVTWQLFSQSRRRFLYLLLIVFATITLVFLVTPLGKMFAGALRYGAEQSSINSIAHGVNWSESFGVMKPNPWLFEAMRAAWLLVALWAAVLIFQAQMLKSHEHRARILVYATPIFIILLLFVVRAAGRIDAGGSRLALAGNWALALLMPLLLYASIRVRGGHVLLWVTLAGLVMPHSGGIPTHTYAANFDPIQAAALTEIPTAHSTTESRLGLAMVNSEQATRVAQARRVLALVLDPDETYLDLSGRHAMYYYVDRPPPVESGAFYNLVGKKQQLRAVESIHKARLPAVLLKADNITNDGGPASLRSNLVYRAVMLAQGYKLVLVGKQTWMIRNDRLNRAAALPGVSLHDIDDSPDGPLIGIFKSPDLENIPASWGRSLETLRREFVHVRDLPVEQASLNDLKRVGPESFAATGDDPFIRFDIAAAHLGGKDAGLLRFSFLCDGAPPDTPPNLVVYWATSEAPENQASSFVMNGQPGTLIVPIDSSPAWLLAKQVVSIRLDVENGKGRCERFSIQRVQLLQRVAVNDAR